MWITSSPDYDILKDCEVSQDSEIAENYHSKIFVIDHCSDLAAPMELEMKHTLPPNEIKKYELVAVCCHRPRHYMSIVKRGSQWYLCDDHRISKLPEFIITPEYDGYKVVMSFYALI